MDEDDDIKSARAMIDLRAMSASEQNRRNKRARTDPYRGCHSMSDDSGEADSNCTDFAIPENDDSLSLISPLP